MNISPVDQTRAYELAKLEQLVARLSLAKQGVAASKLSRIQEALEKNELYVRVCEACINNSRMILTALRLKDDADLLIAGEKSPTLERIRAVVMLEKLSNR